MSLKNSLNYQYYDNPNLWGKNYWNEVQLDRARQTVMQLPETIHSVLDIGCGAGIVSRELGQRFGKVVALDFSRGPLLQVKNLQIISIQANACNLPFLDRTFDAVVATELIEHLTESQRKRALDEMVRVSQRFILLTVPFREVLEYGQVKCAECRCIFNASRHTVSFNKTNMESLLNSEWSIKKIQLFGKRQKRIPFYFIMFAQIFGGYIPVRTGSAICPQCGNNKNYLSQRNWITRFFWGFPTRILPLPKLNNWMAVLYERRCN